MCKAGFAGDDAPRAVFRRQSIYPLLLYAAPSGGTNQEQLLLSADLVIMGMSFSGPSNILFSEANALVVS